MKRMASLILTTIVLASGCAQEDPCKYGPSCPCKPKRSGDRHSVILPADECPGGICAPNQSQAGIRFRGQ